MNAQGMGHLFGISSVLLLTACATVNASKPDSAAEKQAAVTLATMIKVADWQLANLSKHHALDWTHGALYPGYMALDGIQPDTKYREAMMKIGQENGWKNWTRVYHADDYAVAQAYCEMYQLYRDPSMIKPTIDQFDFMLANQPTCEVGDIQHGKRGSDETAKIKMRWWWCDALFMGPAGWAKIYDLTDDPKYLDFMIKEWKATSAFLYDQEEHLYFRDKSYFPDKKKEKNGKKVFWGRGNGWVLGGLIRVLQVLPDNHPERTFFVTQFQEMCNKMIAIQPADGVWRASLLDPDNYPIQETSSTSFICYALAWGINQGLLNPEKAEPALRKALNVMCTFITPDGKLTHVQPIGADPQKFDVEKTEVYGVGAFLMANSELYRVDMLKAKEHATITMKNSSAVFCPERTVSLAWADVLKKLPSATPETIAVMEGVSARWVVSQVVSEKGQPSALLFQTDLHAKQTKKFVLVSGINRATLPKSARSTFARFVPERKDDFAWENDRTAYRAYGPALWDGGPGKTATVGNGIDAFGKNDRQPIVNRIFKEKNYHSPTLGYAMDGYKVGTGPGCGGSAVVKDGKYEQAITFEKWTLLENGPIRSVFALMYATGEVRYFTIDLGSNFYEVISVFPAEVTPAAGVSYRPVDGKAFSSGEGFMAVWEPGQDKLPINMGVALVVPNGGKPIITGPAVWIHAPKGQQFTAYAGSCWSKGKDYSTADEWFKGVEKFRQRLDAKVVVE